jgi:uncharacterized protein
MSLASRLVESFLDLPSAVTRRIDVERDIDVVARDGVVLRTSHYAPRTESAATILVRTPYGRKGLAGLVTGRLLAERGFHVVVQSCRGTFDSGGEFRPMRHERDDGLDTIAWIEKQPWFDGHLFTYGPSYVGFTQWAIADSPAITGMLTAVTASSFRAPTYAGGGFSLDTVLNWATLMTNQSGSALSFAVKQSRSRSRLLRAWEHRPLTGADTVATGREVPFFQEWLAAAADDEYWRERGHDQRVPAVTAPVCMVGGWYDIFLPWQLADHAALRAAGATPRLVVGDWSHTSRELFARSIREGVAWFRALTSGDGTAAPVELYVTGAQEWRTFPDWPPPAGTVSWFLGPDRGLTTSPAPVAEPDRFRFDPADPTPSPGGALLTAGAGRVDNADVEARDDVLVYTSAVMAEDVETIGPLRAEIRLRSSVPFFDVHVRVCDVDPSGRSENISDGLTRVHDPDGTPADGIRAVTVHLWPVAHRFRTGHRIRLQVSGGAHPRVARNPGTGAPLGEDDRMCPVDQEVFLDRDRPSVLLLAVPSAVRVGVDPDGDGVGHRSA